MEDKSLFNSSQSKTISDGLQNFIDAMVEEIVLEGKPFDTQKKYLRKFSENEGLDYDKLEADITTFIEILDSLKTAFSKLQVKLAEEKGKECHISEETVKKLVGHSSQPDCPIAKTKSKNWLFPILEGMALICCLLLVVIRYPDMPVQITGWILCASIVILSASLIFVMVKHLSAANKREGKIVLMAPSKDQVLLLIMLLVTALFFILMVIGISNHIFNRYTFFFDHWCTEEAMLFRLLDAGFMLTPVAMLCSIYCSFQRDRKGFWSALMLLLAWTLSGGLWIINYGSIGHLTELSWFYSLFSFALLLLFEVLLSLFVFMKAGNKSNWSSAVKSKSLLGTINLIVSIGIVLMSVSGVMVDISWFGWGGAIFRLFEGVLW
jgi:hypothetical protein